MSDGNSTFNLSLFEFLSRGKGAGRPAAGGPVKSGMQMADVLTTVSGRPITVEDVLVYLKANGTFRNAIYQIISKEVVAFKARELNIRVSETELAEYTRTRRAATGLQDAVRMNDYCKYLGITYDQWQREMETELLRDKVKRRMNPPARVREVYEEHRNELLTLNLSRIVCRTEVEVAAIRARIERGEGDFSTLAREHSLEENTRVAGGYLGSLRAGMLPEPLERQLFAAPVESMVGPVEQEGYWVLYRIDALRGTELTDEISEQITDRLFNDWLEQAVQNVKA